MLVPGPGLRKRVITLFFGTFLALAVLAGRVFWLQVVRGQELRVEAQEMRTWHIPVEPRRGIIYDRKGRELALSISVDSVVANPAEIRDPAATAARLAPVLDMPRDEIMLRVTRRTQFEWLKRKVDQRTARAVRQLALPGIYLTQETRRVYPKGSLAANVLGFAGVDSQGLGGVEAYYDQELRGKPGSIVSEFDARSREIPQAQQKFLPPQDGLNLQLTIDETIQYIAERELEKLMARARPKGAWILVMNPRNGEILALAQRPSFDPNLAMDWLINGNPAGKADADPERWRILSISNAYPPGSVFKPVTAAMALQEGKVTPNTPFYDTGALTVPGSIVTNWDGAGLGSTTFAEGFQESANTIFARVGLSVGIPKFYEYLSKFGLDGPTGVDLPGEGQGLMPPRDKATPLDLALMSFGQTLTMTPIQVAQATAALVNGGSLVRPHLARAFLDSSGSVVREFDTKPVRRVLSEETSATIRELMGRVVSDQGTGRRAQIPGYKVGGKTGTSQKIVGGRVSNEKYIGSFIGVAPLDDPQLLAYVMVDEPEGIYYGGYVAAPVFQAVVLDALQYLGIQPTEPVEPEGLSGREGPVPAAPKDGLAGMEEVGVEVPDLVNLPLADARALAGAAGLNLEVAGRGGQVLRQVPAPGALVAPGGTVLAYTDPAPGQGEAVTVPDLQGATLRQAARRLGAAGLRLDAVGSGVAVGQNPPPGTRLAPGSPVQVTFRPPPEQPPRERRPGPQDGAQPGAGEGPPGLPEKEAPDEVVPVPMD